VESGDKKYIDGACALTDKDGDVIFSTFDTLIWIPLSLT
jgi:hypothetical protein